MLFCFWSLTSFGQSDQLIISKILGSYDNDSLESAQNSLKAFITERPSSPYTIHARFYLADIAERRKDTSTAILYYKQVIKMVVPDSVDDNYRNYSAKKLAKFCIDKSEFKQAVKYLDIAKNKFPYSSWCGNGLAEDDIYMTDLYSECFLGKGNIKKAISLLTPFMFQGMLADNSRLIKKLYSSYLNIYTKDEIQKQFINAEKTLLVRKLKYNKKLYAQATIKIFDQKVYVPLSWCLEETIEYTKEKEAELKQKSIEVIRNSEIYKLAVM